MKIKLLFLIIFFLINAKITFSQDLKICAYKDYLSELEIQKACGFSSYISNQKAEQVVDEILSNVGLFRNFIIKECPHISNAVAATVKTSFGSFDRYIIYDKAFLEKVSGITGTDWSAISILAHEIGHHLNGHTLMAGIDNHQAELQADEFSGFVLAKMGASLNESLSAINEYGTVNSTSSHPNKALRIQAIKKGWNVANINNSLNSSQEDPSLANNIDNLVNAAVAANKANNYKEGTAKLYQAYKLSPKDTVYLYHAANGAIRTKDYDTAIDYLRQLKDLNYTGKATEYYATDKSTKKETLFKTKAQRDLYIKAGTHKNPREEKVESVRGEIYRNYSILLADKGQLDKALTEIQVARKLYPNDSDFVMIEADFYNRKGDYENYIRVIKEALEKSPNDPDLIYKLGVANLKMGKKEEAVKYFNKTIAVKPNYVNAYINLANIKVDGQVQIFEEMNSLGNSQADNKKYNDLMAKKNKLLEEAIPYLETALKYKPNNLDILNLMTQIYPTLGMDAKYKETKDKIDEINANK